MQNLNDVINKVERRIKQEHRERMSALSKLEYNLRVINEFTDKQLRILIKNPYYLYHLPNAIYSLSKFTDCPELIADPVFSKMRNLHNEILKIDKYVDFYVTDNPLTIIYRSLNKLATKMANRTLTESEYKSLLNDAHPVFKEYSELT